VIWDVFHQYIPYREVERRGEERLYAAAVFWRATVEARDEAGAIALAIELHLSPHPLVAKARQ
jgi:hypothetical protein